jgi:hypothetical protein
MSLSQIEANILQLPPEERRRFASWFYEHEAVLAGEDYIAPGVQAEVLRRSEELRAQPGIGTPVTEQWFDDLKRRLNDARARQAPAR